MGNYCGKCNCNIFQTDESEMLVVYDSRAKSPDRMNSTRDLGSRPPSPAQAGPPSAVLPKEQWQ